MSEFACSSKEGVPAIVGMIAGVQHGGMVVSRPYIGSIVRLTLQPVSQSAQNIARILSYRMGGFICQTD